MIGLGLFKGLMVTLMAAIRGPVTVQYPDRKVGLLGAAKAVGLSVPRLIILAFINVVASAILTYTWPEPSSGDLWKMAGINFAVLIVSVYVVGKFLGPESAPTARFATNEPPPTPRPAGEPAGDQAGGGD